MDSASLYTGRPHPGTGSTSPSWIADGWLRCCYHTPAQIDDRAYRAVLDARSSPASSPARTQAWLHAIETPIRLAEECKALLDFCAPLLDLCWPAVCPDPEIGIWFLETGIRAGLAAAEGNIAYCGDKPEARSLRHRIPALK